MVVGVDAPGFDAGEIQKRVHEPKQSQRIAVRDFLALTMHGRERRRRIRQPVLERSEKQGEWGAELVTDVAEERRLGSIELGQGLGALSLLFVRASIRESRAELVRDEVNECAVPGVEGPAWVEADHQSAGGRLRIG